MSAIEKKKYKSVPELLTALDECQFVKVLLPEFAAAVKRAAPEGTPSDGKARNRMTAGDIYVADVFMRYRNLVNAFERMHQSTLHMGRFPDGKRYRRLGVSRQDWIHYHYAMYCVTIVTVYDASLLLVNEVYRLGLSPKHCTESTVAKNSNVKGSRAGDFLNAIAAITKPYREARNSIVHHAGKPSLGNLDEYESWRWIAEMSGTEIVHPNFREVLFRGARTKLKEGRENELRVLLAVGATLANALIEPFQKSRVGA